MSFLSRISGLFGFNKEVHAMELPGTKPKREKKSTMQKKRGLRPDEVLLSSGVALRSTEVTEDGNEIYTLTLDEKSDKPIPLSDKEKAFIDEYNSTRSRKLNERKAMILKPIYLRGRSYNEASDIMTNERDEKGYSPSTCAGYWTLFNACN